MKEVGSTIGHTLRSIGSIINSTIIKRIAEELILVAWLVVLFTRIEDTKYEEEIYIVDTITTYPDVSVFAINVDSDTIRNEIFYGECELVAQLVEAEAGTEDELGKRYVADVVYNRVEDDSFPDKVEDVIYQTTQFSSIYDGNFDKAAWHISDESFRVALEENSKTRLDNSIIYFRTGRYSDYGTPSFKHGAHYFSTK